MVMEGKQDLTATRDGETITEISCNLLNIPLHLISQLLESHHTIEPRKDEMIPDEIVELKRIKL